MICDSRSSVKIGNFSVTLLDAKADTHYLKQCLRTQRPRKNNRNKKS